jgi:hypothetical protein
VKIVKLLLNFTESSTLVLMINPLPQVGHFAGLGEVDRLQPHLRAAEVVEQPDSVAE